MPTVDAVKYCWRSASRYGWRSGDCPSVDVIDENGFSFPHIKQIGTGADSILAYWQVKGKIDRMFMRPTIKLNIVPKEKWDDFAKAYQDNL